MNSVKKTLVDWWRKILVQSVKKKQFSPFRHQYHYPSRHLTRALTVDIYLPPSYFDSALRTYSLLFFNDGQDLDALQLESTLTDLYQKETIREIIVIGIHADAHRMEDYGIAGQPDYLGRGAHAARYSRFILQELLPFVIRNYRQQAPYTIAGCSLGGLSAFDLAWKHPAYFEQAGVFSGSFWWRSKAFAPDQPDAHRMAHELVAKSPRRKGQRFWFQTGTNDETADRNKNGIIDSIDDTLDLIATMETHGYRKQRDIRYVEVEGGQHNPSTWAAILPDFLKWSFGKTV